ncbi:MAG TPA: hypothetical protein VN914_11005 [Polyangia bacterium]|nr:hypothetical protein [Polyangia bacterium]
MKASLQRLGVLVSTLALAGVVAGCSSATKRGGGDTGGAGGDEETGGSTGTTGGKSGSTGGKSGTGGSTPTGGSSGGSGGSTGGAGGSDTGGKGGSTGGAGGSTGGSGGSTGGAGGSGGATGGAGGGGGAGGTGGLAACWPDPKVIKICHQLENACENCGPTKAVACQNGKYPKVCACFDLIEKAKAGMATDADCEKYAMDNQCTVDNVATTGNVCGTLNCELPACKCTTPGCADEANKGKTCAATQGWGDSSLCQKFATMCPCK